MSMNFTFLSNSVHNATVVDGSTNTVLFEVSTPFSLGKRTTTVTNADGEVTGVYERKWGSDKVTLRGQTMKLHEWFPSNSGFGMCVIGSDAARGCDADMYHTLARSLSSRKLYAPDGKVYVWKKRQATNSLEASNAFC